MKKTTKKDVKEFLKGLSEEERLKIRDEFLRVTKLS